MNLSRINKIQGLQGRDYEIEYLRLLTGKDLQDILLTFEDNSGGGGSQTLAQTLALGNETDGINIKILSPDAIELQNTSLLKKGSYDFGGDGGISRICSNNYEDMWQNGFRHVFDQSGFIRTSSNCFNIVPDSSFDSTLRFQVGSFWTLDDGTTYICRDATVGAAVWEIYSLYEEITGGDFSTRSAAGTLTPGKTYAITDLLTTIFSFTDFRLLLQGFNKATYNGVANGTLIYTNILGTPGNNVAIWEVQYDITTSTILSFYNRAYNVKCTTDVMFKNLLTGTLGAAFYDGQITNCDFSNYTGTITIEGLGYTTLHNCDFSNSSADFHTARLDVAATFSGRILHDFEVPNQAFYPCDFIDTIQINADGTNNMEATITLASSQSNLDFTGFESAGIVNLVPHFGGNSITTISNNVQKREYKIISDDTSGLLSIDTGVDITINVVTNSVVLGQILWSGTWVQRNEIYFYRRSTESFILAKSNIYS